MAERARPLSRPGHLHRRVVLCGVYALVAPVMIASTAVFIGAKAIEELARGLGVGCERAFQATRGVLAWLESWAQGREAEATEDVARRLEEISKRGPHV